jgi:processive 1,2-diacylglycerol beta-glucosyltransferase
MSVLRTLVLTSSTGGGHDARAEAFAAWTERLYGWRVETRCESMLEDSSRVGRFGVGFYNFIQRRAPFVHHPYYLLVELIGALGRRKPPLGSGYFEKTIEAYRPHLIFSVHDFLNRGYFPLARRVLGPENVRCATYCSEFSGGYGYSANWIEPTVDLYISRTQTARDYAVKLGLDPARIRVRGHLMNPCVYDETLDDAGRREFRVQRLGLHPNRFTVFLATGGAGANNHLELLPELKRYASTHQAIVVCGRNRPAYLKVVEWARQNPELPVYVDGFSQQMHLLIQASDVIVTRGGTTTCAKALHYGCPIVFNGFGGIMPQERLTVKFFTYDGGGAVISKRPEFAKLLERWHQSPEAFADIKRRFLRLRYHDDPGLVVRELVELAAEASGAPPPPQIGRVPHRP